jgi:hypothetical protein
MRGSLANSDEASELRGDTTDSRRSSRRPKRGSEDVSNNDSIIDIDENDIRPVNPKRRPKPSNPNSSGDNVSSDRPKNRRNSSDSDSLNDIDAGRAAAASGRRRRPSSRPATYPNSDMPESDDF